MAPCLLTPRGSWDSHMHVFDKNSEAFLPEGYLPQKHSLQDASRHESALGIDGIVLVQPSVYLNDNSIVLATLQEYGQHRARGVVQFDASTTDEEILRDWHKQGVRGVRLNMSSSKHDMSPSEITKRLKATADKIRPLGWVLQMFIGLEQLDAIAKTLGDLDVTIVLDHFGHPDLSKAILDRESCLSLENNIQSTLANDNRSTPSMSSRSSSMSQSRPATSGSKLDAPSIPGFATLLQLLSRMNQPNSPPRLFIKISGAYRLLPNSATTLPQSDWHSNAILEAYTKALLHQMLSGTCVETVQDLVDAIPSRANLVFASDWPHTRYTNVETVPFVQSLKAWCYDFVEELCMAQQLRVDQDDMHTVAQQVVNCLFRDTAEKLWNVRPAT